MKAHKIPFDTHEYVKKAKAVGFSDQQAEFQATQLSQILWEGMDDRLNNLVTKDELKSEILLLSSILRQEMTELRSNLRQEIAELKSSLIMWVVSLFIANITILGTLMAILQYIKH